MTMTNQSNNQPFITRCEFPHICCLFFGLFTPYKKKWFFVARDSGLFLPQGVTLYNVTRWAPGVALMKVTPCCVVSNLFLSLNHCCCNVFCVVILAQVLAQVSPVFVLRHSSFVAMASLVMGGIKAWGTTNEIPDYNPKLLEEAWDAVEERTLVNSITKNSSPQVIKQR